jgi:hypothetical protein
MEKDKKKTKTKCVICGKDSMHTDADDVTMRTCYDSAGQLCPECCLKLS